MISFNGVEQRLRGHRTSAPALDLLRTGAEDGGGPRIAVRLERVLNLVPCAPAAGSYSHAQLGTLIVDGAALGAACERFREEAPYTRFLPVTFVGERDGAIAGRIQDLIPSTSLGVEALVDWADRGAELIREGKTNVFLPTYAFDGRGLRLTGAKLMDGQAAAAGPRPLVFVEPGGRVNGARLEVRASGAWTRMTRLARQTALPAAAGGVAAGAAGLYVRRFRRTSAERAVRSDSFDGWD